MHFRNRGNSNRQCSRDNQEAISLASLFEGECGVVVNSFGGFGLVRRLAAMGLTPGTKVKLLRKCPFRGPVEIEVRGVALALGYGVASKVFVRPLKADSNG
jgi:Fe2+ transport system protein FeoA